MIQDAQHLIDLQRSAIPAGLGILPGTVDWPGRPLVKTVVCKTCRKKYQAYRRGHRSRKVWYIHDHRCAQPRD